jgi:pyridoxal phosphate enzyme (YggS family)
MMIKENIEKVYRQIEDVCARRKIPAGKITVLVVTKGRSIPEIQQVLNAGISRLAENRVQEAMAKYRLVTGAQWQMVGHLQTNKVKQALQIFDLIHSVDSLRLAEEIDKEAAKIGKIQDLLLEVKTSAEPAKYGFIPQQLAAAVDGITKLKHLRVKGLMTIAPAVKDPEQARPFFRQLKELRDRFNPDWLLSMGMSDDFRVAIEEGADIVRLGRIIFQEHV